MYLTQPGLPLKDCPKVKSVVPSFPKFTFNTDNLLATRQTNRFWRGSRQPVEWILSREELHAQHVDLDRELPSEMDDPWYPSFVCLFSFSVIDLTPCFTQAISPNDLESLHWYLMARYNIENLDDYVQLLALYWNTRAVDAQNACQQLMELSAACTNLEKTRLSVIRRLKERHANP